jgi:hypothetical protein
MTSVSPSTPVVPTAAASLADVGASAGAEPALVALLRGVGIETCGDLAVLDPEAIEVRFGPEGVRLWRLAGGELPPRAAEPVPRDPPRADVAWTEYELRDTERLLFIIHGLVGSVCAALRARGEGASALTLRFTLANRHTLDHPVGAARATASRTAWMRLIRKALERLDLPDAVTGLAVRVDTATAVLGRQGDVFDHGFATATAAEQAIAQLLEAHVGEIVVPSATGHALPERRVVWRPRSEVELGRAAATKSRRPPRAGSPGLTLQLLVAPQPVTVRTASRRDHAYPARYTLPTTVPGGGVSVDLPLVLGPDRISGGPWEDAPYRRAYFHCVTADGRLVLLCREGEAWSLHGWWD